MSKSHVFLMATLLMILLSFDIILASGCTRITRHIYEERETDISCTNDQGEWYDFDWGLGGWYACAIGPSSEYGLGNDYYVMVNTIQYWWCEYREDVVWKYMEINEWPTGAPEGKTCKVRWDGFANPCCKFGGECIWEGKWDPDDWRCVQCNGAKQGEMHNCTDGQTGPATNDCEYACGADQRCDEFYPGQRGNCPSGSSCTSDCQCSASVTTTRRTTTTRRVTTTRRLGGGGGGGCWYCRLMVIGLTYTNILVILIAAVIVVIALGGFKAFSKK